MLFRSKGPDVNESELNFTVNKAGEIRFGKHLLERGPDVYEV